MHYTLYGLLETSRQNRRKHGAQKDFMLQISVHFSRSSDSNLNSYSQRVTLVNVNNVYNVTLLSVLIHLKPEHFNASFSQNKTLLSHC